MHKIIFYTYWWSPSILNACNCDRNKRRLKSKRHKANLLKIIITMELELITVTPGSGPKAKNGDTVLVHYEGKLISNGQVS